MATDLLIDSVKISPSVPSCVRHCIAVTWRDQAWLLPWIIEFVINLNAHERSYSKQA